MDRLDLDETGLLQALEVQADGVRVEPEPVRELVRGERTDRNERNERNRRSQRDEPALRVSRSEGGRGPARFRVRSAGAVPANRCRSSACP